MAKILNEDIEPSATPDTEPEVTEEEAKTADESAAEAAENIEETEELKEEEQTAGGRPVCPRCGEKTVSKGHEYCYRCEEALSKTKLPFLGKIFAILSLAACLFCLLIVCLQAASGVQVLKGDKYSAEKNWFSAYTSYNGVASVQSEIKGILGDGSKLNYFISSGYGLKTRIFNTLVHVYDPIKAYQSATFAYGEGVSEKYLAKDEVYQRCKAEYERFEKTYTVILDTVNLMDELQEITPENGETIISMLEDYRGEKDVDNVILDYFIYSAAKYYDLSEEELDKYIDELNGDAEKSGEDFYWLYYKDVAADLISLKKYEDSVPYIEKLISEDSSDYDSTAMLMRVYLQTGEKDKAQAVVDEYCKKNTLEDGGDSDSNYSLRINMMRVNGDYEGALNLIAEAMEANQSNPEYYRQSALVYLAQGKYDEAYEAAYNAEQNAYYLAAYYGETEYYTSDILMATVYVSTSACKEFGEKNTTNAQYIDEVLEDYKDAALPKVVREWAAGEIELADILTKGACDFI